MIKGKGRDAYRGRTLWISRTDDKVGVRGLIIKSDVRKE